MTNYEQSMCVGPTNADKFEGATDQDKGTEQNARITKHRY